MTTHQQPPSQTAQHPEFSLERISRLVSELEEELAKTPPEIPHVQELREETEALKHVFASLEGTDERTKESRNGCTQFLRLRQGNAPSIWAIPGI